MSSDAWSETASTTGMGVSWESIFQEGDKKIQTLFLNAMILTPVEDRTRLLAHRAHVKRKIEQALEKPGRAQLRKALKEQLRLLTKLGYTPHAPF